EPDPTGEALATALVRAEAQQVRSHRPHVGLVVEREDRAVADHAALGGERVEIERGVELGRREDPAKGAAELDRLDRAAVLEATGDVLAQLAHRHPEWHLI